MIDYDVILTNGDVISRHNDACFASVNLEMYPFRCFNQKTHEITEYTPEEVKEKEFFIKRIDMYFNDMQGSKEYVNLLLEIYPLLKKHLSIYETKKRIYLKSTYEKSGYKYIIASQNAALFVVSIDAKGLSKELLFSIGSELRYLNERTSLVAKYKQTFKIEDGKISKEELWEKFRLVYNKLTGSDNHSAIYGQDAEQSSFSFYVLTGSDLSEDIDPESYPKFFGRTGRIAWGFRQNKTEGVYLEKTVENFRKVYDKTKDVFI